MESLTELTTSYRQQHQPQQLTRQPAAVPTLGDAERAKAPVVLNEAALAHERQQQPAALSDETMLDVSAYNLCHTFYCVMRLHCRRSIVKYWRSCSLCCNWSTA